MNRARNCFSGDVPATIRWVLARDGSLTARYPVDGVEHWWAGCSVPRLASAEMLKKAQLNSPVTCFLAPFHAAAVRALLNRLEPEQSAIVIVPSADDFAVIMSCDDFSDDLAAHRVWFAAGDTWPDQLERLLIDQSGLATPSQFVKLPVTPDPLIKDLIDTAQQVFTRVIHRRTKQLHQLHTTRPDRASSRGSTELTEVGSTELNEVAATERIEVRPGSRRLCVAAPQRFRVWLNEGQTLSALQIPRATLLNTSDPAQSAPLLLAEAAIDAGILLTPNLARCDLPNVIPNDIPWLSWITNERIPDSAHAAERDHLLIVDPTVMKRAIEAGWPRERVHAAGWPMQSRTPKADGPVVVLADTLPLTTPRELEEFSSHRVLWETLRAEIAANPSRVLDRGPAGYLEDQLSKYKLAAPTFPCDLFIQRLILPAYAQAIVQKVIDRRHAVRLFGRGWSELPPLAKFAAGQLDTSSDLSTAINAASMLVHVWPSSIAHAIDFAGLPVIHARGQLKMPAESITTALPHLLSTF